MPDRTFFKWPEGDKRKFTMVVLHKASLLSPILEAPLKNMYTQKFDAIERSSVNVQHVSML